MDPSLILVFEDISTDFFMHTGLDYLVYTDHMLDWPCVYLFNTYATTRLLIRALRGFFEDLGVPVRLCTDGDSQYSLHGNLPNFLTIGV